MSYTNDELIDIWEKGHVIQKYDKTKFRRDECGAWMIFAEYGNRASKYGWEVDHINPKGEKKISNLRPLQWENNLAKSDDKLKCVVIAQGIKNVNVK